MVPIASMANTATCVFLAVCVCFFVLLHSCWHTMPHHTMPRRVRMLFFFFFISIAIFLFYLIFIGIFVESGRHRAWMIRRKQALLGPLASPVPSHHTPLGLAAAPP